MDLSSKTDMELVSAWQRYEQLKTQSSIAIVRSTAATMQKEIDAEQHRRINEKAVENHD